MSKKTKIYFITTTCFILFSSVYYISKIQTKNNEIETIWGESVEPEDVITSIIQNPIMQRIKDVDQSGPARYFGPKLPKFSRFEHCIGVWAIIKKTGAGIKEQVAGLLHDVSHTVFSHVSDHLYSKKNNIGEHTNISYQDKTHMQYLTKANLKKLLETYNISEKDLDPSNQEYKILEQPLPDMCADRIHYNIHTGVIMKHITKEEAKNIIDDINYKDERWFFTNQTLAKKFAELSIYFTQNFWGASWNVSMNIHLANSLKRAIQTKLISHDDLYLTDSVINKKLSKNHDKIIQTMLQQCKQPIYLISGQKYIKVKFVPKFRGIDPFVKISDGVYKRLSEIDCVFKNYYDSVKQWCSNGYELDVLKMD